TCAAAPATIRLSRRLPQPRPRRQGSETMTVSSPAQDKKELRVVGKRLPRVDARERVTGGAVYPADLHLRDLAHAKLLRSPYAHARIRGIDTSRAAALKGVLAVV